ncbi:hypothetical protein AHAS_Ahas08G0101600 [Arachis hypogaea]
MAPILSSRSASRPNLVCRWSENPNSSPPRSLSLKKPKLLKLLLMIQEDCCMELRPSSSTLADGLNPSSIKQPTLAFHSPWIPLVIPRIESALSPIFMRLYFSWTAFADALKKILLECCDGPQSSPPVVLPGMR